MYNRTKPKNHKGSSPMERITGFLFSLLFTLCCAYGQPVTFTIDVRKKAQTIENIGASGAWFSEDVGKHWPAEKKERMAGLLFSRAFDGSGNPLGIGLSAWRFNIGGGTAEQGDSSGIANPQKRVECFLSPGGAYDWNKQQGYLWFVKKAAAYGVKDLIAFSNTPPVQFTKNGRGFKTEKDYTANLREEDYGAYADFLATVLAHFDNEGLHFNYVSPVNEPQWDWSGQPGRMSQEGSPWHNRDIYKIAVRLDSALTAKKLSTKILLTEAGDLRSLYEGKGHAARQLQTFYAPGGPLFLGKLKHLRRVVEGHSYFTDAGDTAIVGVRARLRDTAAAYKVPFWQSEYSLLGDGYKEGVKGKIPAMDCALFLAKIIYHDLVVANATAWHFWNSWEPGSADADTRYFLLALKKGTDGAGVDFAVSKNLWALGHYSRFVRPGMHRLVVGRSDHLNDIQTAKDLMLSAFTDGKRLVAVVVNYTGVQRQLTLEITGVEKAKPVHQFITTAGAEDNLAKHPLPSLQNVSVAPRSMATFLIDMK